MPSTSKLNYYQLIQFWVIDQEIIEWKREALPGDPSSPCQIQIPEFHTERDELRNPWSKISESCSPYYQEVEYPVYRCFLVGDQSRWRLWPDDSHSISFIFTSDHTIDVTLYTTTFQHMAAVEADEAWWGPVCSVWVSSKDGRSRFSLASSKQVQ